MNTQTQIEKASILTHDLRNVVSPRARKSDEQKAAELLSLLQIISDRIAQDEQKKSGSSENV